MINFSPGHEDILNSGFKAITGGTAMKFFLSVVMVVFALNVSYADNIFNMQDHSGNDISVLVNSVKDDIAKDVSTYSGIYLYVYEPPRGPYSTTVLKIKNQNNNLVIKRTEYNGLPNDKEGKDLGWGMTVERKTDVQNAVLDNNVFHMKVASDKMPHRFVIYKYKDKNGTVMSARGIAMKCINMDRYCVIYMKMR